MISRRAAVAGGVLAIAGTSPLSRLAPMCSKLIGHVPHEVPVKRVLVGFVLLAPVVLFRHCYMTSDFSCVIITNQKKYANPLDKEWAHNFISFGQSRF